MSRAFVTRLGERHDDDFFEGLDTRVKILTVFVVTTLAIAGPLATQLLLVTFVLALALSAGLWRWAIAAVVFSLLTWMVLVGVATRLQSGGVEDPAGFLVGIMARGNAIFLTAAWLITTTKLYDFGVALESLRVPVAMTLPLTVAVRFIPTLLDEMNGIWDALRVRGLVRSPWDAARHPKRVFDLVLTPSVLRSLRLADELACAAETRGMGGVLRRTPYRPSRMRGKDRVVTALLLGAAALCVAAAFVVPNDVIAGRINLVVG
ncbi:energy-coupling factor transporter transmembrane protein EcfT [bacterium]|nr:energy-coupling factor transporter transmembrane protein EcfT [bacterium]